MEVKISEYAKQHGVTYRTVWLWIKRGLVKAHKIDNNGINGHVRIIIDEAKEKNVGVYCRVSIRENKDNLERQKERLVSYCNAKGYKVAKIVTEVGSGLNDKRPKLQALLDDKKINLIVVEHKDRLCRFGLNYIERLLAMQGRTIEIVNPVTNDRDDLMQDFVSIITSFCSRLYGLRRTKRQTERLIKELETAQE